MLSLTAIPILSAKCPNLEELDVTWSDLPLVDFAELLCAHGNGVDRKWTGQLFPRLHSLVNRLGDSVGKDL
jgi:hypothetical protein